jgi:hypothetical protein
VHGILEDVGFETTIQKTIATARGKVEIDVFAKRDNPSSMVILSECKYWNRPVPKSAVHAFSKVIQDYGANVGYIISKMGFNAGAYDAANFTNIQLLTWEEFKDIFEVEWLKGISTRVRDEFRLLMDCTEPLIATSVFKLLDALPKGKALEFGRLRKKFAELGSLTTTIAVFDHAEDLFGMKFPSRARIGTKQFELASSWQLVDWIYAQGNEAQKSLSKVLKLKAHCA